MRISRVRVLKRKADRQLVVLRSVEELALMGMKHMGDATLGGMVKGRHKSIFR